MWWYNAFRGCQAKYLRVANVQDNTRDTKFQPGLEVRAMNPQLRRLSASVAALAILVIPANANYVRAESPGVRGLAHVKGVNLNMVATAAKLAGDVQKAEPAGEDLSELNPFM